VFAAEEVAAGLSSGRFLAADLAWREGMAAWTPLGDWPEFRGVGAPPPRAPMSAPSAIPWEQGRSIGSFFATIRLAVLNPAAFATGRFAFGGWLAFCYVAMAFSLPFQAAHFLMAGDQNEQLAALLGKIDAPWAKTMSEQLAQAPPTPAGLMVFSAFFGLAFAPLIYAGFGLLHWVGQRIFRLPPSVERTVASTLLACGVVILCGAPLNLLGFDLPSQVAASFLFIIPASVVYYRVFGVATGVNPWVQFGVSCFVWFVLFCCCCAAPAALFAFISMR
ncbi:MAG: DUF4339 domain-containing protein, partial [Verrucomicrobiota bacterium]